MLVQGGFVGFDDPKLSLDTPDFVTGASPCTVTLDEFIHLLQPHQTTLSAHAVVYALTTLSASNQLAIPSGYRAVESVHPS